MPKTSSIALLVWRLATLDERVALGDKDRSARRNWAGRGTRRCFSLGDVRRPPGGLEPISA